MFLVEKTPKDNISSLDEKINENTKKNEKKMSLLIAKKLNLMLDQSWTPSYCKQRSLRYVDNTTILKEGCKNSQIFDTISLAVSKFKKVSKFKNKYSKGTT
jgi:hypothetical protein